MKVSEAYSAAAALGGENSFESAKWFYINLNLALDQINRLRPLEGIAIIYHKSPATVFDQLYPRYVKAGDKYTGKGVTGVTFRATGKGKVLLTVPGESEYILWECDPDGGSVACSVQIKEKFGIDSADAELTVTEASHGMMISNLAFYGDPVSKVPEYGRYIEYRMSDVVSDFSEFASVPLMANGSYCDEISYRLGIDSIMLPRDAKETEYHVIYRKRLRPAVYTSDPASDMSELDIRTDAAYLLPPLLAYLCNIYSDPELAAEFKKSYDEQSLYYLRQYYVARSEKLVDRTGWM